MPTPMVSPARSGWPAISMSESNAAEQLTAAFDSHIEIAGQPLRAGLTIGVGIYPQDGLDAMTLVANADAALLAPFYARGVPRGGGAHSHWQGRISCHIDAGVHRQRREVLTCLRQTWVAPCRADQIVAAAVLGCVCQHAGDARNNGRVAASLLSPRRVGARRHGVDQRARRRNADVLECDYEQPRFLHPPSSIVRDPFAVSGGDHSVAMRPPIDDAFQQYSSHVIAVGKHDAERQAVWARLLSHVRPFRRTTAQHGFAARWGSVSYTHL